MLTIAQNLLLQSQTDAITMHEANFTAIFYNADDLLSEITAQIELSFQPIICESCLIDVRKYKKVGFCNIVYQEKDIVRLGVFRLCLHCAKQAALEAKQMITLKYPYIEVLNVYTATSEYTYRQGYMKDRKDFLGDM